MEESKLYRMLHRPDNDEDITDQRTPVLLYVETGFEPLVVSGEEVTREERQYEQGMNRQVNGVGDTGTIIDDNNDTVEEDDNNSEEEDSDDEEVDYDFKRCYRLIVNDGICSYDQVYLLGDIARLLKEEGKLTYHVLLKVLDFQIVRADNDLETGKHNDIVEEEKRRNDQKDINIIENRTKAMEKPKIMITSAEVLNHPVHKHSVRHSCGDCPIIYHRKPEIPDMSKYLLWRIDDPLKSFSDFTIRIEVEEERIAGHTNGEGQLVYHVHKNVLAFGLFVESDYFAALFNEGGRLHEAINKNEICIQLTSIQARSFPILLDYFYTGKLLPENDEVIDEEAASLILLADYFRVPSLIKLIEKRIGDGMKNVDSLSKYLPCLIVSQHVEELKPLYKRAVFIAVEACLSSHPCMEHILSLIDVQFLVKVLELCRQLTRIHIPLLGQYVIGYKETQRFERGTCILGIITKEYLDVNKDHTPHIANELAQHISDMDKNETTSRCSSLHVNLENYCIKILTTDSKSDLSVGHYQLCTQKGKGHGYFDYYYTNSRGQKDTSSTSHDFELLDYPHGIFHLVWYADRWVLRRRNSEERLESIGYHYFRYSNDAKYANQSFEVLPPAYGWRHRGEPFFLQYCLKDEIDGCLPSAV